jgi:DNA mismatch repair protein MutS
VTGGAGTRPAPAPPRHGAETVVTGSARPRSILFPRADDALRDGLREEPEVFHDLNLGPVVEAITAGRQEYDLEPFFHARLSGLDEIAYRQEAMRDMEDPTLRRAVASFAERMRTMRERLAVAGKSRYELEKRRWHLGAAEAYTEAVALLAHDLPGVDLSSRALRGFREDLSACARSEAFRTLMDGTRSLVAALEAIRYCVLIRGDRVTVLPYDGERDYSAAVEETFRKFRQGAVKDYRRQFKDASGMNHVEAEIAYRVALLNPDTFGALARFCDRHADFVDAAIASFDREVQFYAATLEFVDRLRGAGLPFCIPEISDRRKDVSARGTFDVALADKRVREGATVVTNDFFLRGDERILVVTGPNQGGKTTFARTFGQMHYLASLGCPVPGTEARLFLCDRLFTHFEREEDITNLRGKLEDDLVRIRGILDHATPDSVVIINEIFSSTTLEDAVFLGREVLGRLVELDLLCVFVTFLDELSALGEKTVSMVAAVDARDPARRTFKVERQPADGLAYALAIAEKHRVTYRWLTERIRT